MLTRVAGVMAAAEDWEGALAVGKEAVWAVGTVAAAGAAAATNQAGAAAAARAAAPAGG